MKAFYMNGDYTKLYFTNYERRSDDEEFDDIMSILKANNCEVVCKTMAPDCDLIRCIMGNGNFKVIRTVDGDGTYIHCEDFAVMQTIEKMFEMK